MAAESTRALVVHYHEIGLKGGNRGRFEKQLRRNMARALEGLPIEGIRKLYGRFLVLLGGASKDAVAGRLRRVFGIRYLAPVLRVSQDMETICETALRLMDDAPAGSFALRVRRSNKAFPLTSIEIARQVGARIVEATGRPVDLGSPDVELHVDIVDNVALLYAGRIEGPGGLPVGVSERAVVLLSSGIDSPVASAMILRRGVTLSYAHFHSAPMTSSASQDNVRDIVQVLARYSGTARLHLIPLLEIQRRVMMEGPPRLRVLLYRRAMVRLAERVAERDRAVALVTGESVGQVASQTLSNLRAVDDAATLPILRPLSGMDKEEIIARAHQIGTYDISIEPDEDCCSLFVPRRPATKASIEAVRRAEESLALGALLDEAFAAREELRVIAQY